MAANAALAKINKRVKELKKNNPKMKHRAAQKQAGIDYRAGRLGSVKTVAKKVHKVAKRAAKSVKSHYDLHKANSRARLVEKCKSISGVRSDGLSLLNDRYGKLATKKLNAKGVREKRKIQKEMTATAGQIRKIKSL